MRVLYLLRQEIGGLPLYAHALAQALEDHNIEVVIDQATSWIPNDTSWGTTRKVNKLMKDAAKGLDLVHAWGMRPAWACSEAFYLKFPWVFTAYDKPKTTAQALMDRLAPAKMGICPNQKVKSIFADAHCTNVEVVHPGVWKDINSHNQEESRTKLGIDQHQNIVISVIRNIPESRLELIQESARKIQNEAPDILWVVHCLDKPDLNLGNHLNPILHKEDLGLWLSAANVFVETHQRTGFSYFGAVAMQKETPILVEKDSGLESMGVEDVSIETYESEDELPFTLLELLNAKIHLEALSQAARIRADERFSIQRCAEEHAEIYRDFLT